MTTTTTRPATTVAVLDRKCREATPDALVTFIVRARMMANRSRSLSLRIAVDIAERVHRERRLPQIAG